MRLRSVLDNTTLRSFHIFLPNQLCLIRGCYPHLWLWNLTSQSLRRMLNNCHERICNSIKITGFVTHVRRNSWCPVIIPIVNCYANDVMMTLNMIWRMLEAIIMRVLCWKKKWENFIIFPIMQSMVHQGQEP